MRRVLRVAVILVVLYFFTCRVSAAEVPEEKNLIRNGGLEGEYQELPDDHGFIAPAWLVRDGMHTWGTWSADPESPHHGKFSQKLEIKARMTLGIQQNANLVSLQKEKEYAFSLWHKGTTGEVLLYGLQLNPRKDILLVNGAAPEGKFEASPSWKKYETRFRHSEDVETFNLRISATGPGILWVDDVALFEQ